MRFYRQHAIQRMFERKISTLDVETALRNGLTVEDYPLDTPYPSCLWLGFVGPRPIHIVIADNDDAQERIVITVYEPDAEFWESDFATRKER